MSSLVLSDHVKETLSRWKHDADTHKKPLRFFVGVDIGGTNTRVALVKEDNTNETEPYLNVIKFQCNDVKNLVISLTDIGHQVFSILHAKPLSAALDAAGPIRNRSEATITNYHGSKELNANDLPDTLFPKGHTVIINDLESACEGISALNAEHRLVEFFDTLWAPEHSTHSIQMNSVNYLVLAMGTGLGCGLLVSKDKGFEVLPLETGHTIVNALGQNHADYTEERDLLSHLSNQLYSGNHQIEYEDICSGRGLGYCYQYFSKGNPIEIPQIVPRALQGESTAEKAAFTHYRYLFRAAQTQCVGLQAKGVFLAGDNQVNNDAFVAKFAKQFREEFENHPKKSWIENVAVYKQTKSYNLNLHGCLFVARRLVQHR